MTYVPGGSSALILRRGDRGPAVAEVAARLARIGLLPGSQFAVQAAAEDRLRLGPRDDVVEPSEWETTAMMGAEFDEPLENAVRTFQRQRGITEDGVVGAETFRRLEEARWKLGDRILSLLEHPSVGEDVLELQRRLNAMGFACGKEDGHLGPRTDSAIRDFQANVGVQPDGSCGPKTFRALGQLRRTVGRESSHNVRERYSLSQMRTGVRDKTVVVDPTAPARNTSPAAQRVGAFLAESVRVSLADAGAKIVVPEGQLEEATAGSDRASECNELGADLVIALTVLDDGSVPGGVSAYYYGREGGPVSVPGELAAAMLVESITERTSLADCSEHPKTWDLLRMTRMPAVRLACGNLAHPVDEGNLTDRAALNALAGAISDAVIRFFSP